MKQLTIEIPDLERSVSGILVKPRQPKALLVLGHGAGAGMEHEFMAAVAESLASRGIATLRYNFPYMEDGKRRPDHRTRLMKTVAAVIKTARAVKLPLFLGGKSMGGRMSSLYLSENAEGDVKGLIFLGFPLHTLQKIDLTRAEHLSLVKLPMFFAQGTRDKLAQTDLIKKVVQGLGRSASLHIVETGDHSLKPLKRSGKSFEDVLEDLGEAIASFIAAQLI